MIKHFYFYYSFYFIIHEYLLFCNQGHPTSIFGKYLFGRLFETLEDYLRYKIFGTFFVKFRACLPRSPRIFEHLKNGIIAHF